MHIRLATKEDFDFFFELKSEEFNIFWTGGESAPERNNLEKFFYSAVDNAHVPECRKIYIIENEENLRVGHLYIIPNGEEYELATAIREEFVGNGYARRAIRLGLEEGKRLGFKRMVSSIREDNVASMKAYKSCGVEVLNDYKEVFIPGLRKNVKMYIIKYEYACK